MKFEIVSNKVKDVPYISKTNAKVLFDFIIKNKPRNILELGFAHGTASCYISAALDEIGEGKLTSVDLIEVKDSFKPSIEEQLISLDLDKNVSTHRMKSGYNWFLHNEIRKSSNSESKVCLPKYDLIIIDGPKNWTIDSSSFFLCDKILKDKGWIIWDDYNWTYANADTKRDETDGITHRSLSEEERLVPHIKEIFELLVVQHPDYGNFVINEESDWAWAQKIKNTDSKKIKYTSSRTINSILINQMLKIYRKIKKA